MLSLLNSGKKLTDKETRDVCRTMHDEGNPSEYILLLENALDKGYIDPNVTLVELVTIGSRESDLYPIAISLRYGGNSNVYVSSSGLSQHIHLLGLAYDIGQTVQDEVYAHTLLSLLILDGASLTKKIFDPLVGSIKRVVKLDDGPNVMEWLVDNGFEDAAKINEMGIEKYLKRDTLNYLYILLDQPDKIEFSNDKGKIGSRNLMIIRSRGVENIVKLNPTPDGVLWNSSDLNNSVSYLNLPAFNKIIASGVKPSYPNINDILLRALRYRQLKLDICEKVMLDMISILVSNGVELDRYQLSILSGLDGQMYEQITKEYSKPFWRKTCNSKDPEIPLKLRQLAVLFDIPIQSKDFVCGRLIELAKRDPAELTEAIKTQKTRQMGASLGWTEEFIAGNPPTLVCTNKLPVGYNEYSNLHLSSYRESDESVWCFTADQYESLISTGRNPYGGDLPKEFIEQLKFKLNTLRSLNIEPSNTNAYHLSDRIKMLSEADKESNDMAFLTKFDDLLEKNGVVKSKYLKLTNEQIKEKMNKINIAINVTGLTTEHAQVTYAWIMVWLNEHEPKLFEKAIADLNARNN